MGASGHFASHNYIECPATRFVPGAVTTDIELWI